jgi:hypothetical protein
LAQGPVNQPSSSPVARHAAQRFLPLTEPHGPITVAAPKFQRPSHVATWESLCTLARQLAPPSCGGWSGGAAAGISVLAAHRAHRLRHQRRHRQSEASFRYTRALGGLAKTSRVRRAQRAECARLRRRKTASAARACWPTPPPARLRVADRRRASFPQPAAACDQPQPPAQGGGVDARRAARMAERQCRVCYPAGWQLEVRSASTEPEGAAAAQSSSPSGRKRAAPLRRRCRARRACWGELGPCRAREGARVRARETPCDQLWSPSPPEMRQRSDAKA